MQKTVIIIAILIVGLVFITQDVEAKAYPIANPEPVPVPVPVPALNIGGILGFLGILILILGIKL